MLRIQPLARRSGANSIARALFSSSLSVLSPSPSSSSSPSEASTPIPTVTSQKPVQVVSQAPNKHEPWSTSQNLRPAPASNPRFEQVAYEFQPAPLSAMEMVNNEQIILSDKRTAVCDGGGGPLGHPKIFINLDKPGPRPCGYCGLRFQRSVHHHH